MGTFLVKLEKKQEGTSKILNYSKARRKTAEYDPLRNHYKTITELMHAHIS